MRKQILKHAFVILNIAFVLGLVTGIAHGTHSPSARAWLVGHLTGILISLLMSVVGLLWNDLQLGRRAQRVLYWSTVPINYVLMGVLGIAAPALGASPGLVAPEAPPAPPGVQALVTAGIILATVASFALSGLVVYGLRQRAGDA